MVIKSFKRKVKRYSIKKELYFFNSRPINIKAESKSHKLENQ